MLSLKIDFFFWLKSPRIYFPQATSQHLSLFIDFNMADVVLFDTKYLLLI